MYVCMYMYVYVWICIYMYVCMCMCMYMYVYVCMNTCMYAYVCNMYVHVCWDAWRNGHKLYYYSLPPSVIPCARAYMYGVWFASWMWMLPRLETCGCLFAEGETALSLAALRQHQFGSNMGECAPPQGSGSWVPAHAFELCAQSGSWMYGLPSGPMHVPVMIVRICMYKYVCMYVWCM